MLSCSGILAAKKRKLDDGVKCGMVVADSDAKLKAELPDTTVNHRIYILKKFDDLRVEFTGSADSSKEIASFVRLRAFLTSSILNQAPRASRRHLDTKPFTSISSEAPIMWKMTESDWNIIHTCLNSLSE